MKVSIITVTFNSARTLQQTINSVAQQSHPDIEYIIIDGGSADQTLDIIEHNSTTVTKFVSEKDEGIYDAMNKGIGRASGEVICFLNSDDYFCTNDVIAEVVSKFKENGDIKIVIGDLKYVASSNSTEIIRIWTTGSYKYSKIKFGWMPPHPSFFAKRALFNRLGNFDLRFKIAADYDLMIRFLAECTQSEVGYIPQFLVEMRDGGISNYGGVGKKYINFKESLEVLKKNKIEFPFLASALKSARKIFQFPIFNFREK